MAEPGAANRDAPLRTRPPVRIVGDRRASAKVVRAPADGVRRLSSPPMREPGLPVDGAPACPFVAFEDDRDARSTAPDHRHRCYAEPRPAPRALAHQEAYCLSSAFAVCPTFQDWARREAAAARPPAASPGPVSGAPRSDTDPAIERGTLPPPDREARHAPAAPVPPLPPHRPAPREWAAPPPWLDPGGRGERGRSDGEPASPPPFLADRAHGPAPSGGRGSGAPDAGRGLAGSDADRIASGLTGPEAGASRLAGAAVPPERVAAERMGLDPRAGREADVDPRHEAAPPPRRIERRDRVPAERPDYTPPPARHAGERRDDSVALRGPSWEQPRRFEAYPSLRTRVGLPSLPGSSVLVGFVALVMAAAVLFFLPAFLGVGDDEPSATPTPTPVASVTPPPEPTPTPAPTPTIHVVSEGETLSKIASDYGLTLDDLLAANPQITDADRIAIGDEVIIPATAPSAPSEVGGGAEVTPAP